MPTDKRLLKVFLCHAHSDAAAVRALYARLTKDGVDAWLYKERPCGERHAVSTGGKSTQKRDLKSPLNRD